MCSTLCYYFFCRPWNTVLHYYQLFHFLPCARVHAISSINRSFNLTSGSQFIGSSSPIKAPPIRATNIQDASLRKVFPLPQRVSTPVGASTTATVRSSNHPPHHSRCPLSTSTPSLSRRSNTSPAEPSSRHFSRQQHQVPHWNLNSVVSLPTKQ